jgi:hypothetical protein
MYVSWCQILNPCFISDISEGKKLDLNESVAVESAKQFELSLILNACQNNTEWYYKWTGSEISNWTAVYKHTYHISLNM